MVWMMIMMMTTMMMMIPNLSCTKNPLKSRRGEYSPVCDGTAYLTVAAWRSGNVVGRINEVTLRRARLALGWVTAFGRANHLGM